MRSNSNNTRKHLTAVGGRYFKGLPLVQTKNGERHFYEEYLETIKAVMDNAFHLNQRVVAFRIDLTLPHNYDDYEPQNDIRRFIDSLKSQLKHAQQKKKREGKRCYAPNLRYIWAKECSPKRGTHYHMVLFFNRDAYFKLGSFDRTEGNLQAMIKRAWASALGMTTEGVHCGGLVNFTEKGTFWLDSSRDDFQLLYERLFHRLSYLAKVDTKAPDGHVLGSSRISRNYSEH